jgi:hypothetical protein
MFYKITDEKKYTLEEKQFEISTLPQNLKNSVFGGSIVNGIPIEDCEDIFDEIEKRGGII